MRSRPVIMAAVEIFGRAPLGRAADLMMLTPSTGRIQES